MQKNISRKAPYLRPETEVIQVFGDIHLLAGSGGVSAETGSENAGNIFGAPQGQHAKKFGTLWDEEIEPYQSEWKFSTYSYE